uniref:DUF155 domain-containing protein n=1 Tax=Triticum urartu TaxID=4572 RepID=A0A8R7PIJ6_TRIUA
MKGCLDYIVLKSLDTDGIRIISSVPGQSIALDYCIRQVDDMVEEFTEINRIMEKTGDFTMKNVPPPTTAKAAAVASKCCPAVSSRQRLKHCRRCLLTSKTEALPPLFLCARQTCIDPQFSFTRRRPRMWSSTNTRNPGFGHLRAVPPFVMNRKLRHEKGYATVERRECSNRWRVETVEEGGNYMFIATLCYLPFACGGCSQVIAKACQLPFAATM